MNRMIGASKHTTLGLLILSDCTWKNSRVKQRSGAGEVSTSKYVTYMDSLCKDFEISVANDDVEHF